MSNNLKVSQAGLNLIKSFEGCVLTAYQDTVGVWTIGYGSTSAVVPGGVYPGMAITQAQAEEYLELAVQPIENFINSVVTVPLNQNQFDALADFCYNLGCHALQESTLLRVLNEGSYSLAAAEYPKWDMAGGSVSGGLLRRRLAEQTLFNTPV